MTSSLAYSYIRFSTAKQSSGDSLRRQTALAKSYAVKHGLTLSNQSYQDLGVSGFDKSNITRGALAAFLVAVKNGVVQRGSYLLIENFDRLTRADISDALRLLLDLTAAGLTVVTLQDEKVWNTETVNDMTNLMFSLMLMSRANDESLTKSKRLRQVWAAKKATAANKKLTAECPKWLQLRTDRSDFDIIADRVESIQKVFTLRINGFGCGAIARRANGEKWPAPGLSGTWHTSLINRLLTNRALIGEYQPRANREGKRIIEGEPVAGYFPVVITDEVWAQAQAVAGRHAALPRRRNYKNILQGLLKCTCGASFVRKNKASAKQPGYAMYYCADRLRNVTNCASIKAGVLEAGLLHHVALLSPSTAALDDQGKTLERQIDSLELEKKALSERLRRLIAVAAGTEQPIPELTLQINTLQAGINEADAKMVVARNLLIDLQNINPDDAFDSMYTVLRDGTDEQRSALRERLLRLITHVEVHSDELYLRIHSRIYGLAPLVVPLSNVARIPGCN